ncbi:MAG: autotransporter domain-containing protein, partial [Acetobacteraceae bacterium]
PSNTFPVDAFGILAASVGGGGGAGGSAASAALTVAEPFLVENVDVGAAFSLGLGGDGGSGGGHLSGTNVSVSLNQGSAITTFGNGGHGVLAMSVGGGGGEGGDSSALAATVGYNRAATQGESTVYEFSLAIAQGGSGGAAGDGGPVQVGLGGAAGSGGAASGPASIVTYGDFADGIVALSVGGGGGNAGAGANTTVAAGGARTFTAGATLGSTGGSGGTGGPVSMTIFPQGSIATYGDAANGAVALSVGGGGGTSQGGTFSFAAAYQSNSAQLPNGFKLTVQPKVTGTWTMGMQGGSGGNGGDVSVDVQGTVATQGGDASGILALSVGKGGGLGGSSGSQGSADNPISPYTKFRAFASNVGFHNIPFTLASLSGTLGSDTTGSPGTGGTVTVTQSGSIITQGDWSTGVHAQSVGGGGGRLGTALGTASGPAQVNLQAGVHGYGNAGPVNLQFQNGTVQTGTTTTGYAAFGVVGQSVGGGGGFLSDGSDAANGQVLASDDTTVISSAISLGGNASGSGNGYGWGNTVTLSGGGTATTPGLAVTTHGEAAHGVVLQSVGAGGGITGAGSSFFNADGLGTGTISLAVGGGVDSVGAGGTVTVDNAKLHITTSGANAFGLLAQSVGGGGGLGFTQPGVPTTVVLGGNAPSAANTGGSVSVTLAPGTTISTSGVGAHAIVLQSVGGGGGIAGYAGGSGSVPVVSMEMPVRYSPQGSGGPVTLQMQGGITTTGAGAFAVLAQSIASGGGLLGSDGVLYAGSTGVVNYGTAGAVTVTLKGSHITATGQNSVGVFAQSMNGGGSGGTASPVAVNLLSTYLSGGSGAQGTGIWVSDGIYTSTQKNFITLDAPSFVSSGSGVAINYTGSWSVDVQSAGEVHGSYFLGPQGTYSNGGTLAVGATGQAALLTNSGVLQVGEAGAFGSARLTGNFVQTASGAIVVDADFANRRSATLTVGGDAVLGGTVRPALTSVLPGIALPFMTVNGNISGELAGAASTIFGYGVTRSANALSLAATSADFTPAGFNLPASRTAVADHLQAAWNHGGSAELAPLFALLGNTADAGGAAAYSAQLRQLSPDTSFAPGARGAAGAQNFASSTLSCPQFEGTTAMLVEGDCGWMRMTGRTAHQASDSGITSFRLNTATWQIGGQKQVGNGWLVGGSLAYETSWLSSQDGLNSGSGQAGYGAVVAKYQTGPWLFAASAFGGAGQMTLSRVITLPGFASVAKGSPDTANVGLLLRAAYTLGEESFYLRPHVSLTTVHVRTGSYREYGGGALNLAVDSASQTTVILTPMLEVGGRVTLGETMLLRPFVAAGLNVRSNDGWRQTGRLISAPAGAGGFTTTVPIDQVTGRVSAGVQLYTGGMLDFRLQYEGDYGGSLTAHGGSAILSVRF